MSHCALRLLSTQCKSINTWAWLKKCFSNIPNLLQHFRIRQHAAAVRSLAVAGCRTLEELLVVEELRDQLRPPGQDGATLSDGCAIALAKAGCATLTGVRALGGAAVEAMPAAFRVEVARCLFGAKPADLGDGMALALLRAGCRTRDDVLAHEGGGAAGEEPAAFKALILEPAWRLLNPPSRPPKALDDDGKERFGVMRG